MLIRKVRIQMARHVTVRIIYYKKGPRFNSLFERAKVQLTKKGENA